MRVLYDTQIFGMQKFGGISNYFANIISSLKKTEDVIVPHVTSDNEYIDQISDRSTTFPIKYNFKGKNRFISLLNKIYMVKALKNEKYDVFHPTYYKNYHLKYLKKPFVITVYDMIHELFPEYFHKNDFVIQNKQMLCNAATRIIAISAQTKLDLIKIYNIPKEKIDVVYLATDFKIYETKLHTLNLPSKYILFVGNRQHYKNFNWMLEAIAPVLKNQKIHLLCIGPKFNSDENYLIKKLYLDNLIIQTNVKASELPEVYNRAELFIFPSIYEGFGIPILEAFASKVPVLLANASCFPEVAGDAAMYFEIDNMHSLQQQVEALLNDSTLRNIMIEKGLMQLSKYSWDKCAADTLETYKKSCEI